MANTELRKLWMRANMTQRRLNEAIAQGAPAIKVAKLATRLEVQRREHRTLRERTLKV